MVKILGGEIVPDDDPRLSQSSGQDQLRGDVDTGRTSQASSSTFDWSAPPVRVQYEEGGTGMAGLPGLVVFGAPVSPNHCLMLAAAAVFFGLRGVCVGAILWYVWIRNRGAPQTGAQQHSASQHQQQQRIRAASQFFSASSPPQQNHAARRGVHTLGGEGSDGAGGSAAGESSEGLGKWQGKGKAYKLSN